MGRTRSFEESAVIRACADAFLSTGYEGTSIDDLVTASGLHRGSLYKAFGSKRGIFVAALRALLTYRTAASADAGPVTRGDDDLLLVALLELAPRDDEVRALCEQLLSRIPQAERAADVGARLLTRAGLNGRKSK